MLDRAKRAEAAYRDDYSEPGAYWKAQYSRLVLLYADQGARAQRQQARGDRFEALSVQTAKALIRAEKALRRYERYVPVVNDTDPEGRS